MRIFDTYVQKLKYKVLTELARQTWVGNDAFSVFNDIANQVVKKGEPTMSCCIYKDRAIVAERIRIALGGKKEDHNVIQVIDIACDECPVAGHVVTDLCRGCVAHACVDACKLGAITVDSPQKAEIDKSKCVECGKCAKSCPYSAIANFKRPCEKACKVDAISMAPDGVAPVSYTHLFVWSFSRWRSCWSNPRQLRLCSKPTTTEFSCLHPTITSNACRL